MPRLLIVDDSDGDRDLAREALESDDVQLAFAETAEQALALIERQPPDLVVTDLRMPGMNGLELVQKIAEMDPAIPVVLMTGLGTEDIASEALRAGAASYVPKRYILRDLRPTVAKVLHAAQGGRALEALARGAESIELRYRLRTDPGIVQPLIGELQSFLIPMGLCDRSTCTLVGIALTEAVQNALYHGNLELVSRLECANPDEYALTARRRFREAPYRHRCVDVAARFSSAEAVYVFRDEGKGFDPARVPDPTAPENIERCSGRGLLLMRTFMDEVRYNAVGNEVTLVKRRATPASGQEDAVPAPA